jgi:hypothetical protein
MNGIDGAVAAKIAQDWNRHKLQKGTYERAAKKRTKIFIPLDWQQRLRLFWHLCHVTSDLFIVCK